MFRAVQIVTILYITVNASAPAGAERVDYEEATRGESKEGERL